MTPERRAAYLDALGIDWYRSKHVGDPPDLTVPASAEVGRPIATATTPPVGQPGSETSVPVDPTGVADDVPNEWPQLRSVVASCQSCTLGSTRTQAVFGVGNEAADLMIVGEAPGAEEDRRGEPFVGRAGHLLDAMLTAIGLSRTEVFIANILKCRPPNNRDPQADEVAACRRYLERQIALVSPRLLLAVGRIAAHALLDVTDPLGRLRGRIHETESWPAPVIVTYHPAYLLRTPAQKARSWQDLKAVRKLLHTQ
ncbi:MAG: uracil-DNA glycosylase [Pseudomonadota bacterium]